MSAVIILCKAIPLPLGLGFSIQGNRCQGPEKPSGVPVIYLLGSQSFLSLSSPSLGAAAASRN